MRNTQLDYGTGKNPAENVARVGRKTQNLEREIANAVAKEMEERQAAEERERQRRYFSTTNSAYHD